MNRDVLRGAVDAYGDRAILPVTAMILAGVFLLFGFMDPSVDVENFFEISQRIKSGGLPYGDVNVEFPQLSLLFICFPGIFTDDLGTYAAIFSATMSAVTFAVVCVLMRICGRTDLPRMPVAAAFMAMFLVYSPQAIMKLDMAAVLFAVISLCLFIEGRTVPAFVAMAAGAMVKIYPAILIPVLLAFVLVRKGEGEGTRDRISAAAKGLAACVVVVAACVVPFFAAGVSLGDTFGFVGFHSDRGFQVESLVAVAIRGLGDLGLTDCSTVPSHSTYDVVGSVASALQPYWLLFTAAVLTAAFAFGVRGIMRFGRYGAETLCTFMFSMTALFMLTNKVFSTQYVLWVMPFMALLIGTVSGRRRKILFLVCFAAAALSAAIVAVGTFSALFVPVNVVRDILLFVVFADFFFTVAAGKACFLHDRPAESRGLS